MIVKQYIYRREAEPQALYLQALPLFPASPEDEAKAMKWFAFLVKSPNGNKVGRLTPGGVGMLALNAVCAPGTLPPGPHIQLWYASRAQHK